MRRALRRRYGHGLFGQRRVSAPAVGRRARVFDFTIAHTAGGFVVYDEAGHYVGQAGDWLDATDLVYARRAGLAAPSHWRMG